MPKVRKVFAAVKFDETRFDFTLTGGAADGLAVEGGTVEITGLDETDQFLDLDLRIAGSVSGRHANLSITRPLAWPGRSASTPPEPGVRRPPD